jgi:hypothetical protein
MSLQVEAINVKQSAIASESRLGETLRQPQPV